MTGKELSRPIITEIDHSHPDHAGGNSKIVCFQMGLHYFIRLLRASSLNSAISRSLAENNAKQ